MTTALWIFLFLLIGYSYLKYTFWEPSEVGYGSLVYQLKIPEVAKSFPIWRELELPRYSLRIADGEKPRSVKMVYVSALDIPNLISHAKEINFDCLSVEATRVLCFKIGKHGNQYQVSLDEIEEGTQVIVNILGDS